MSKKYLVKVESNPTFCGIDAGGVQFANGEAMIEDCPLVGWFKEHKGYSVQEISSNRGGKCKDFKDKDEQAGAADKDKKAEEKTK